jgi:hypothetical protein
MEKFRELSFEEMQEVDGGYWRAIYEAIKSGVIYDGIKAGVNFLLENPTEKPEWLKHKMGGL